MRRLPPWIWLILAAVFGITASLAWIKNQSSRTEAPKEPTVFVLTAKRDIPPATRLSADQLQAMPWSQANLPRAAFTKMAALEGRVTAYPLVEGELILEKKLAPKGTVPGLTALLPANKRAMTVKVDEASGVAGFVAPENRVDVVVTISKGEYNNDPLSRVLLQNLRVLGTGQRIENRPGDKPQVVPTVTLEVSPEDGERLALAAQVSDYLGLEVHASLPRDVDAVNRSINEGRPLAETDPRHPLCQALRTKAAGLAGKDVTGEAQASGWG